MVTNVTTILDVDHQPYKNYQTVGLHTSMYFCSNIVTTTADQNYHITFSKISILLTLHYSLRDNTLHTPVELKLKC